MQIKFQKTALTVYLSILLNILLIIVIYFQLNEGELFRYINSDTLYLPTFFRDLFYDKLKSVEWVTPAATCFFPDLILFFTIHLFTRNFIVAMFMSGIVMSVLLCFGFYLLIKESFKDIPPLYCSFGINLLLLFHFAYIFANDYTFTFYLTIINYHLGAFITSLFSMYFTIRFVNSNKLKNLIYAGIIYALTIASDFLAIFYLIIPLLALNFMILKRQTRNQAIWVLTMNISSFGIGFLVYHLISISQSISILDASYLTLNFSRILDSYRIMFNHHFLFIKTLDIRAILFLLSIISFIYSGIILVKKMIAFFKPGELSKKEILETVYLLLLVTQIIAIYNAPAINGLYVAPSIFRYNVYAFFIAILNYSYIVYKLSLIQIITRYIRGISIITLVVFTLLSFWQVKKINVKEGKSNLFNYYPEYVREIDDLCHQYDLKYGLSSYWIARRTTMLSHEDVRIFQTYENLRPYDHHVVNLNWYYGSRDGKETAPVFQFIVPVNLNDSIVYDKLENHIIDTLQSGTAKIIVTDPFMIDRSTKELVFIE